ncbi:MBL fold metallo-hydrolase [Roseivivax marinus]|uniref:MBL fold metallo-hydrolase n=1 Tax=Roseivivax marinus TaxID=1379903 RepID=UPI001F04C2E9|nr:MBL fold metallo-hydrolase [Roseivivax marinus]UMA66248.1 MBL fold metallo-hydrolase [Roseivivax marinus]
MSDPQPEFRPVPGTPETVAPGIVRVLAPNPSPMTFRGTNTYLVGEADLCVIDPGPDDPIHLRALLDAIGGRRVSAIAVTHAHVDHAPLAETLSALTGAPVAGFGTARAGRSAAMTQLAESGLVGGGEGVDHAFRPDRTLADGETLSGGDWSLRAIHTPGHMGNHLCFALGDRLFSGDLVMGWASSLVSPPDGDLTDFMASLARLQEETWQSLLPGHGAPVSDPATRLADLVAHRRAREAAILDALEDGPADPATLAARIYTDTPAPLLPAAERNVLAHLVDLVGKDRVTPLSELSPQARFARR